MEISGFSHRTIRHLIYSAFSSVSDPKAVCCLLIEQYIAEKPTAVSDSTVKTTAHLRSRSRPTTCRHVAWSHKSHVHLLRSPLGCTPSSSQLETIKQIVVVSAGVCFFPRLSLSQNISATAPHPPLRFDLYLNVKTNYSQHPLYFPFLPSLRPVPVTLIRRDPPYAKKTAS